MGGRCNSVRAVHRITNANANGDCDSYGDSDSYGNGYTDSDGDTYTAEACSNTETSSHAAASPVAGKVTAD